METVVACRPAPHTGVVFLFIKNGVYGDGGLGVYGDGGSICASYRERDLNTPWLLVSPTIHGCTYYLRSGWNTI
jgi:hypothetical protein